MTDSYTPLLLTLWKDLRDERILWQVATLVLSLAIAHWISYLLRPRLRAGSGSKLAIGLGGLRRLVFPLAALTLVLTGRWMLASTPMWTSRFTVSRCRTLALRPPLTT